MLVVGSLVVDSFIDNYFLATVVVRPYALIDRVVIVVRLLGHDVLLASGGNDRGALMIIGSVFGISRPVGRCLGMLVQCVH